MKRYVIEREIPGASDLSQEELAAIAGKSNDVVESLGVPYRWITSYVAGDKIYCVHEADDEDAIREHARRGGFPANSVNVIANEFGPHTAAAGPLRQGVAVLQSVSASAPRHTRCGGSAGTSRTPASPPPGNRAHRYKPTSRANDAASQPM